MRMHRWLSYLSTIAEDIVPVGAARIAAAIVYKNELISVGICSHQSHPTQKKYQRTRPWYNPNNEPTYRHAEIDALIRAQKRVKARGISLKKCTLYVARVKRASSDSTGFIAGLAKPCEGCMKAIHEAGLINIIYTEG